MNKGEHVETNGAALATMDKAGAIEAALVEGDLSKLSTEDRITYYTRMCDSVGLNPTTKPFEYLKLNGKLVLYARKDCTDQLRSLRKVSIAIVARENVGDVYVVTARATLPDGRTDESTGAVACAGLRGDNLANALMKAETKSKRRVTLSICGLGILDESEVETVSGAVRVTESLPVAAMPRQQTAESGLDEEAAGEWAHRFAEAATLAEVEELAADCKAEVKSRATLLAISTFVNAAKARVGGGK